MSVCWSTEGVIKASSSKITGQIFYKLTLNLIVEDKIKGKLKMNYIVEGRNQDSR